MTFKLGLTGSIGMGKTTTATMFAEAGLPVWDADAAAHRLYARGGMAVEPLRNLCPDAHADGAIDRGALKRWIRSDPAALGEIERVVHPMVRADRDDFIRASGAEIVVLDIPLLYETGADADMDAVVVVSAPSDVQRARVLARPGMTEAALAAILERQMPDAQKRARADYVVETTTLDGARGAVHNILKDVRERIIA